MTPGSGRGSVPARAWQTPGVTPASPLDPVDPARLRAGGGVKWGLAGPDVLPAWVADMDLGIPPAVRERLADVIRREDLGYPYWPDGDPVVAAFERRMRARFDWEPRPNRTRVLCDIIQAFQVVIELATRPGDGVAVHVPTYPPFLDSIAAAGRTVVPIEMVEVGGRWVFETDGLAERLRAGGCTLLALVNPHNPTGRVFDAAELGALAGVARELDLTVFSDEIHADLTYAPFRHLPFAALSDDAASRTVTATSATKAFNIAGVACAVAHVGSDAVWERLRALPDHYFGTPSVLGRVATVAAWDESEEWHEALMVRLGANRALLGEWAAAHPSGLRCAVPEATYLSWIDFAGTPIAAGPAAAILEGGRVMLNAGADFSRHTDLATTTFARLNFATDDVVLGGVLAGIDRALAGGF